MDVLSSVWTGIVLATLLFIYCSIGSAIHSVRQHPWLEMTEFEWFHWWPFNLLVALFCLVMILATVRRIPFRLVNAGVWMIHAGIVILCLGSYLYFSTKVEGDAPVFRRLVSIMLPGMSQPASMLAAPGASTTVTVGPDLWRFMVQSTNSEWPILSEEHKGTRAYAVNVMVQPPFGESFVRQLLAGFPQYTEDVLPGKGRAIKAIGRKLVHEDLALTLEFHPTTHFHVKETWALFTRRVGEKDWVERPIDGLPRYNDRISSRDQVFSDPHVPLKLGPMDLPVPPAASGDALSSARVHVTGFLPYAHMQRRWREGGDRLNPVLQLSLVSDQVAPREYELIAMDPKRNHTEDGNVQFIWLPDTSHLESLPMDSRPMLRISVPEINIDLRVPISPEKVDGEFMPLGEGRFAYRITALHDNLILPGQDRPVSFAVLEIRTPEGPFLRWVASVPELTRDMPGESADPHAAGARPLDARIVTTYQPQSAPLIFAAHPGGLRFVLNAPQGRLITKDVQSGELVPILEGLALRVDGYVRNALADVKPFVVPPSRREKVGETFSMIRLEVQTHRGVEAQWLNFARYVFPDPQYALGGRFAYSPAIFQTEQGQVEVVFSRRRVALPSPVAMEDFQLDTHLGGFTGNVLTIRNYISRLRFQDQGRWTEPVAIAVNSPTEFGGYWYFQSEWDRPDPNVPGSGMNFTGLGIGNRHGVYVQLAGCCLAVVGMTFAFYIKPIIKRRRVLRERSPSPVAEAPEYSPAGVLAESVLDPS